MGGAIRIVSDYSALDKLFDRIDDMPNAKQKALLDEVLDVSLKSFQEEVHIRTGSLLLSGKTDSNERGKKWIGTLSAGGQSTGIHNPVTYASLEKSRGGEHDFFGNQHLLKSKYVEAVRKGLVK